MTLNNLLAVNSLIKFTMIKAYYIASVIILTLSFPMKRLAVIFSQSTLRILELYYAAKQLKQI